MRSKHMLFLSLLLTLCSPAVFADVLLIPDSFGDKVWAFSTFDGRVISEDFIPDDGRLIQPINATDSGRGTILISDENADAVFEYGFDGTFIQVIADASDGLDALQGIAVHDGAAYVGSRTAKAIFRIDLASGDVSIWAEDVGTPRDIVFRRDDVLVSNSDSQSSGGENIERYAFDGTFLGTLHDSDGVDGIDFPQQLLAGPGGVFGAAGFSNPRGLYGYDADGTQLIAYTNIITSPRGVAFLKNGMILYAGGTRVVRYDPRTETEETIVNALPPNLGSFRYIERSAAPARTEGDATN